jgi:hypothetical protein
MEAGMFRLNLIVIAVAMCLTSGSAKAGDVISAASDGWTISADVAQNLVVVSHDRLGAVMKAARLNVQSDRGLVQFKDWSVEKKGLHQLSVRTARPVSAWLFEMGSNALRISSTSADAVLIAEIPSSTERVLARLMDPDGVPVDWVGTNEVAGSYGGSETHNRSFLPLRNPECMYFALGQVDGSVFHSLFDRKTDTAISFSETTLLQRDSQDSDLLHARIPVPGNTLVRIAPDYYARTLGVPLYVRFDDSYFTRAPAVWCSWTSYYSEVREEDIVRNADWLAANLKPYGFEYVQLDDGYDRGKSGEHYWIENWDRAKFPHGPQWLTGYIKSKGLRPGLWLVPNAYAGAVEQHPDWYVRDKDGKLILDYHTPTLDSTNPQVLGFLKKLFTTLREWGFEYYKFDGEHAFPKYVPSVDKNKLYDKSVDPIVAYHNRLRLIRETVGPKTFIEGCPAGTPLNGIGYFNSVFAGHDVYNSWQGMYALFSSINANAFLNHMVIYLMPGEGIEVGPTMTVAEAERRRPRSVVETARTREDPMVGFGTTLPEARTLVTYLALTGVVYPLASILPELPEERVRLLKMTLPPMPVLPVDLFSRGTDMQWNKFKSTQPDYYIHNYPEILDLKVNAKSGTYDVVGFTNWRSGTDAREISLSDKLGLTAGAPYVAFDFWGQKLLGIFRDRIQIEIEPHDTRVVLIHPLGDKPQLVGDSRHISGAYSILDLEWDASARKLRGSSRTVPGEDYAIWIFVPDGMAASRAQAKADGTGAVSIGLDQSGNSLKVVFSGAQEALSWEVEFTGK